MLLAKFKKLDARENLMFYSTLVCVVCTWPDMLQCRRG